MRRILGTLAAAAAMAVALIAAPASAVRPTGEERLAKLIEGRTAGTPRDCIVTRPTGNDLTVIDGTALVYRAGGKLWVNRTRQPFEELGTQPTRTGSSLRAVLDFFPT